MLDICEATIADFLDHHKRGDGTDLYSLIADDLRARQRKGVETYGESLHTNNGRDALVDEYEELCDAAFYARQSWEEHRGKPREERHRDRYLQRVNDVIELRREIWERDGR